MRASNRQESDRISRPREGASRSKLIPENLVRFLEVLRHTGNVTLSARQIGMSRSTIYAFASDNPSFKTAMREALEEGRELLLGEAWRRATTWTELDLEDGKKLRQPPSDRLLAILIQGYFQEFKPSARDTQAPDNILPEDVDLTKLSDRELNQLEALVEKASGNETSSRAD